MLAFGAPFFRFAMLCDALCTGALRGICTAVETHGTERRKNEKEMKKDI